MFVNQPRILSGRYELGELLGAGGIGSVYKARHVTLRHEVAVKILNPYVIQHDPRFLARFQQEAQMVASLDHPGIVSVYDLGEDTLDGQQVIHYLVMQMIHGTTLLEAHRTRPRSPEEALRITAEILDALDHAHQVGIIHRDVKPANVMLTSTGAVKVMDFGIARLKDAANPLTQAGTVIGTFGYMSPEQAEGKTVDARTDVYAVGCVLYELLTGTPPFTGDAPAAVLVGHLQQQALPPSQAKPALGSAFDPLVLTALAKDPAQRYQSAAEMRAAIGQLLPQVGNQTPPAGTSAPASRPALLTKPATSPSAAKTVLLPHPVGLGSRGSYGTTQVVSPLREGRPTRSQTVVAIAGRGRLQILAFIGALAAGIIGVAGMAGFASDVWGAWDTDDLRTPALLAGLSIFFAGVTGMIGPRGIRFQKEQFIGRFIAGFVILGGIIAVATSPHADNPLPVLAFWAPWTAVVLAGTGLAYRLRELIEAAALPGLVGVFFGGWSLLSAPQFMDWNYSLFWAGIAFTVYGAGSLVVVACGVISGMKRHQEHWRGHLSR